MKTTEEKIAIMQAYVDGQHIQYREDFYDREWSDFDEGSYPTWDWSSSDYRIKPAEPRTRFFVEWMDGSLSSSNFDTFEEAVEWASNTTFNAIVEFKEVVE